MSFVTIMLSATTTLVTTCSRRSVDNADPDRPVPRLRHALQPAVEPSAADWWRHADGRLPARERRVGAHRSARREGGGPRHHRRAQRAHHFRRAQLAREETDQPYFGERCRGAFRRQIQLGDGLDLQNLEADLHDGVLAIRIPVAEQAKPRKIAVGEGRLRAPEAIETSTADAS